jgi:hypothetical protein
MVVTFYLDVQPEVFYEPRYSRFLEEVGELGAMNMDTPPALTARIVHLLMAHLGEGDMK